MDMVFLNIEFLDLTIFPFAKHFDVMLNQFLYGSFQYAMPVLGNPDDVVLTFVNHMAQFLIFAHHAKIGIAIRTLPPAKQVDF